MDSQQDDRYLVLEQYRIYSDAKERFIDRQFTTNKFYLVLNLIFLLLMLLIASFFPQDMPIVVLSIIGGAVTFMWWMNIDSYQMLIKVKYAKVLEYLETKLPEQPYHKEFVDYSEMKKQKNVIVFGDFQKILTFAIMLVYISMFTHALVNMIKFSDVFLK